MKINPRHRQSCNRLAGGMMAAGLLGAVVGEAGATDALWDTPGYSGLTALTLNPGTGVGNSSSGSIAGARNFSGEYLGSTDSFVNLTAIPETRASLLGGIGLLFLLRRRNVPLVSSSAGITEAKLLK